MKIKIRRWSEICGWMQRWMSSWLYFSNLFCYNFHRIWGRNAPRDHWKLGPDPRITDPLSSQRLRKRTADASQRYRMHLEVTYAPQIETSPHSNSYVPTHTIQYITPSSLQFFLYFTRLWIRPQLAPNPTNLHTPFKHLHSSIPHISLNFAIHVFI